MRATCSVYSCMSTSYSNINKVRFHQFPMDQERRRIWIEASQRPDLTNLSYNIIKNKHLCSLHFANKMYGKKHLKATAVPTLNLPASHMSIGTQTESQKNLILRNDISQGMQVSGETQLIATRSTEENYNAATIEDDSPQTPAKLTNHSHRGRKLRRKVMQSRKEAEGLKLSKLQLETGKSEKVQASSTGQYSLDATASLNNDKISKVTIKIEPLEPQEDKITHASLAAEPSKENLIPIPTELLNTEDAEFKTTPPPIPNPSQCLPKPSEPISCPSPICTAVAETVSATKIRNLANAEASPRISCKLCYKLIKGYTFMCVQCDYRACKRCDFKAEHNRHYVLRVPVYRSRNEVEAVIKKIDELIVLGKSLAADIQLERAIAKAAEKSAPLKRTIATDSEMWVDNITEENTDINQKTLLKPIIERQEKIQKTEIINPSQNVSTQYTVHVLNKVNSQIPERDIAELIVKTNENDIHSERKRIPAMNADQESTLTKEEIESLHTVKDEIDDPVATCEQYPDATDPLSDQQYVEITLPIRYEPSIRFYESTSSVHQPSKGYMSGDDEDTDSTDEDFNYL